MAFITITSDTTKITTDFGVYAGQQFPQGTVPYKRTLTKNHTFEIELLTDMVQITVQETRRSVTLSYDGVTGSLKVDSINAIAPTSNTDLYEKLINLF